MTVNIVRLPWLLIIMAFLRVTFLSGRRAIPCSLLLIIEVLPLKILRLPRWATRLLITTVPGQTGFRTVAFLWPCVPVGGSRPLVTWFRSP